MKPYIEFLGNIQKMVLVVNGAWMGPGVTTQSPGRMQKNRSTLGP